MRQCGSRVAGGAYACVPLGPGGRPVEDFLVCPPVRVDAEELGLSSIGVKVVPRVYDDSRCEKCQGAGKVLTADAARASAAASLADDAISVTPDDLEACFHCQGSGKLHVWHVFDIVGAEFYPNVADFIEETRMLGVSRRCELNASQYRLLDQNSRLILLHPKAHIANPEDFFASMYDGALTFKSGEAKFFRCPQFRMDHAMQRMSRGKWEPCAGLWYHDLEPESVVVVGELEKGDPTRARWSFRELACGAQYQGYVRSESIFPNHSLAIFASFPLHHFEVVTDESAGVEDKLRKFDGSGVSVDVCEE